MPSSPVSLQSFARLATRWHPSLTYLLIAAWVALLAPAAQADLSVFPTRIVLEQDQRAAQVELMNTGTEPQTYRVSLVNRRMGENGEFIAVEAPGPGERFADPLVRFSPRQMTIPAGGSQVVRLLVRKPADLAEGEYRSHLQFDRVADTTAATSIEALAAPKPGEIGVVLRALVGASIPVIVRQGRLQAQVMLDEPALLLDTPDRTPQLAVRMNRSGSRSVYGDLSVSFTPQGGEAVEIGRAGGVAVYVPNPMRRVRIALQPPPGLALRGGSLRVSYRERTEAGGALLGEAVLPLP